MAPKRASGAKKTGAAKRKSAAAAKLLAAAGGNAAAAGLLGHLPPPPYDAGTGGTVVTSEADLAAFQRVSHLLKKTGPHDALSVGGGPASIMQFVGGGGGMMGGALHSSVAPPISEDELIALADAACADTSDEGWTKMSPQDQEALNRVFAATAATRGSGGNAIAHTHTIASHVHRATAPPHHLLPPANAPASGGSGGSSSGHLMAGTTPITPSLLASCKTAAEAAEVIASLQRASIAAGGSGALSIADSNGGIIESDCSVSVVPPNHPSAMSLVPSAAGSNATTGVVRASNGGGDMKMGLPVVGGAGSIMQVATPIDAAAAISMLMGRPVSVDQLPTKEKPTSYIPPAAPGQMVVAGHASGGPGTAERLLMGADPLAALPPPIPIVAPANSPIYVEANAISATADALIAQHGGIHQM